ncbi:zinc ribbon domain-containing protein [Streptomyces sp. NPDC087866]|uniref:zinc ribbon domain-containing protein n=2 Tax=Streptomyces TaxID=1883 RepID=UPI00224E3855|nr:zinc ribbon domain-containing protein [Streptomyces sp. NBC_01789]MCX4451258.1 transposase [Streptomyces sp. NBC_01789]
MTVTAVNPAYSQTCHRCGHVDRKSRRTRSLFTCTRYGHVTHADIGVAHNRGPLRGTRTTPVPYTGRLCRRCCSGGPTWCTPSATRSGPPRRPRSAIGALRVRAPPAGPARRTVETASLLPRPGPDHCSARYYPGIDARDSSAAARAAAAGTAQGGPVSRDSP